MWKAHHKCEYLIGKAFQMDRNGHLLIGSVMDSYSSVNRFLDLKWIHDLKMVSGFELGTQFELVNGLVQVPEFELVLGFENDLLLTASQ